MSLFTFSKEDLEKLEEVNALFNSTKSTNVNSALDKSLKDFWSYLQKCESYHLNETYKTEGYIHDMENMLSLFIINFLIDEGYLTSNIRALGLPQSKINLPLTDDKTSLESIFNSILDFLVAEDGTLYFMSKYCQLDVMWTVVLLYYAFYKYIDPYGVHSFVVKPNPQIKNNKTPVLPPLNAKIAIIGDWGTGAWKDGDLPKAPAQLVIEGVEALKPDYVIHLGDVYYAGTSNEERNNLLGLLKGKSLGKLYTMNSNHEMYDGANGLYDVALESQLFSEQLGRTFFSIDIGDWILVGLDSAYFDDSALYMEGSLYKDKKTSYQYKFLNDLSKQGKPIFLMTHHNGIGIKDHNFTVNTKLWDQVKECLDGNMPDMWYWGHVHNGIVYNTDKLSFPNTKIPKSTTGKTPQFRCCGHASIPFGNGSGFYTKKGGQKIMRDELEYYSHTPLDASHPTLSQRERVLNGFAVIDINGSDIKETFYEVSNANPKPKAVWWSK
ncbi:metallophosphoesterase [uncultured Psychroserpens sp.]|uniref:metallophosphoesterase family protein n=1 Tax=uncultured Psychroserpens sp. TaxID=255436 RepID=UPI00260AFCCF|nr:metallophosphoesterase [uncultured Psychroserpens sp.]